MRRGYLGIAAQPARVSEKQKSAAATEQALLVVDVKPGTPADDAGLSLDGHALASPDELFDLLVGDRVGKSVAVKVLRGGAPVDVSVTVAPRS